MELVQVQDALDLKDRFTDFAESDIGRNSLKEDIRCAPDQWHGRGENDHGDDQ